MLDIKNEFNINMNVQVDTLICCVCPKSENVEIDLNHKNAHHIDFGPGFRGWATAGQCSLGERCVAHIYRTFNRGCNVCSSIIHEGECMNIHKADELNAERRTWMINNIEIVSKHYKRLLRKGIISKSKYDEYNLKLEKYILA